MERNHGRATRVGGIAAIALGVLVGLVPVNLVVVQDTSYGSYERFLDLTTWPAGVPAVHLSVAIQMLISVSLLPVAAVLRDMLTQQHPHLARLSWVAGSAAAALTLLAAMVTAQIPLVAALPARYADSVATIDLLGNGVRAAAWWCLGVWSLTWAAGAARSPVLPRALLVLVVLGGVGGVGFFAGAQPSAPGPLGVLSFAVCGWAPWLGVILLRRAAGTQPVSRATAG